ncbi:MAG: malto-oligosyltrehalose trehalohydrolase [Gemmataceae bacterium]
MEFVVRMGNASPFIGARLEDATASFRVWAPDKDHLSVVLEGPRHGEQALEKQGDGYFTGAVRGLASGQLYRYRIGSGPAFPDVASRSQPHGVHGPSELVDLTGFPWSDSDWVGVDAARLVIYELHVGAFTPEGTFQAAAKKLPQLRDLGVTAIELMPLADFPGQRNWGYDGVALFAPARCYGRPEDLQRFVDRAHQLGLAVLLDVVYNHLGPDGNYTGVYSPHYVTKRHHTPWGAGLNFDGAHSRPVRDFFLANALHWLRLYHFDGLRLDATQCIIDDSPKHFLAELAERVHVEFPDRKIHLIAEDNQNLNTMFRPMTRSGWGLDGVWADDFHHETRRLLHGDNEGYYRDYQGSVEELVTILNRGWLFSGQHSIHKDGPRGTDPSGLDPWQFVFCIQNHDQIGNRAFGERLGHEIDAAAYRAASALLLLAPQTPLLFMGQEWDASTPFLFFTDHNEKLGKLVTEGRRREFEHFRAFSDPVRRHMIPDPQADETFRHSKLKWNERETGKHAATVRLYQALLRLRREHPAFVRRDKWQAVAADRDTLVLRYFSSGEPALLVIARLRGAGVIRSMDIAPVQRLVSEHSWRVLLTTEEAAFAADPAPGEIRVGVDGIQVAFARPGAMVFGE